MSTQVDRMAEAGPSIDANGDALNGVLHSPETRWVESGFAPRRTPAGGMEAPMPAPTLAAQIAELEARLMAADKTNHTLSQAIHHIASVSSDAEAVRIAFRTLREVGDL